MSGMRQEVSLFLYFLHSCETERRKLKVTEEDCFFGVKLRYTNLTTLGYSFRIVYGIVRMCDIKIF